jgi:hypothetical protein
VLAGLAMLDNIEPAPAPIARTGTGLQHSRRHQHRPGHRRRCRLR